MSSSQNPQKRFRSDDEASGSEYAASSNSAAASKSSEEPIDLLSLDEHSQTGKGKQCIKSKEPLNLPKASSEPKIRPTRRRRRPETDAIRSRHRVANVYDATDGRVTYEGFIKPFFVNDQGQVRMRSRIAVPPDEVLARRVGMQRRQAAVEVGEDVLPYPDQETRGKLPDSDLLLAFHEHASSFYERVAAKSSFNSMDETALLAFGMIMEEMAESALCKNGELSILDPQSVEELKELLQLHDPPVTGPRPRNKSPRI